MYALRQGGRGGKEIKKPGIRESDARPFCFDKGKKEVRKSERVSLNYRTKLNFEGATPKVVALIGVKKRGNVQVWFFRVIARNTTKIYIDPQSALGIIFAIEN